MPSVMRWYYWGYRGLSYSDRSDFLQHIVRGQKGMPSQYIMLVYQMAQNIPPLIE